jgi:hypothetical protein
MPLSLSAASTTIAIDVIPASVFYVMGLALFKWMMKYIKKSDRGKLSHSRFPAEGRMTWDISRKTVNSLLIGFIATLEIQPQAA